MIHLYEHESAHYKEPGQRKNKWYYCSKKKMKDKKVRLGNFHQELWRRWRVLTRKYEVQTEESTYVQQAPNRPIQALEAGQKANGSDGPFDEKYPGLHQHLRIPISLSIWVQCLMQRDIPIKMNVELQ